MHELLLHVLPTIRVNSASETPLSLCNESKLPLKKERQPQRQRPAAANQFCRIIRDAKGFFLSLRDGLTDSEREGWRRLEERKQILWLRMKDATTRKDWDAAARDLDQLEGNDAWKLDSSSGDYNPVLIATRLAELDNARTHCDIRAMMHLVRTALSRDLGGMGNIDLYRHSYTGTKRLIEKYVESCTKTIEALVEKSGIPGALSDGVEHKDLLEGMLYARQSFGRSALLLSGGATFGMSHIGVLKAIYEAELMPRIISGASAGSIVCAVLCTRTDEEIPKVLDDFPYGDLDVFEESGNEDGLADHLKRLFTQGSWSDIKHLSRVMRGMLGDITFQEAYNRTRRICNICVSSASLYELPRLLNYITAPNVMIWSAVAASCSVPLVFNAGPLLVKDPATGDHLPWNPTPQRWIDGSVDNDLPMTRLAEMFNVNHFIVSQVNPHVVPFLSRDDRLHPSNDLQREHQQYPQESRDWMYTLSALARDEALHRLHFLAEIGIFPNLATKLQSILSQKYSGNINILPEISVHDLPRVLKNPTADFMLRSCLVGERAAWPKLSRIRDRCAIELALDKAVHALRARVVFSKSQVDLRRLVTGSEELGCPFGIGRGSDYRSSHTETFPPPSGSAQQKCDPETLSERHRQRRNSGSNIQLVARHKKMLQALEGVVTDDETEEEERLELNLRRGGQGLHLTGRGNANKPRLKRSAKSHFNLPLRGHMTNPLLGSNGGFGEDDSRFGFDFSKPLSPRMRIAAVVSSTDAAGDGDKPVVGAELNGDDGSSSIALAKFSRAAERDITDNNTKRGKFETRTRAGLFTQASVTLDCISTAEEEAKESASCEMAAPRGEVVSPAEETSNPDQFTSDVDIESRTEDSVSDLEPYEQSRVIPLPSCVRTDNQRLQQNPAVDTQPSSVRSAKNLGSLGALAQYVNDGTGMGLRN